MELLQLVKKFKSVFSIEKIEDVVDELKSTLLNAEKCRKLCEDWILICPDLTIDYMQMIFQYYFADRKEKMQDYTPKSLAVAVAELSKTKDEKICLDLCAGSGALTIQKWNENNDLKFICKEYDSRVIPFLLFNLAIRNIDAEVIHCDVLSDENFKTYRTQKGDRFATVKEITKSEFKADCCISNPPYNMKWEQPVFAQLQNRFSQCEVPPESNANYAFVLTALDEITGKASFILPNGVLSTDNQKEKQIRQYLVKMNFIESIIVCPDNELFKQDNGTNNDFSKLTEKICGEKIVKNDYFKTTKNKNEITFSNNSKENISSILMMIFNTWKQHIYYLNFEENRYLAELRDALLPELMSGKIDIGDI